MLDWAEPSARSIVLEVPILTAVIKQIPKASHDGHQGRRSENWKLHRISASYSEASKNITFSQKTLKYNSQVSMMPPLPITPDFARYREVYRVSIVVYAFAFWKLINIKILREENPFVMCKNNLKFHFLVLKGFLGGNLHNSPSLTTQIVRFPVSLKYIYIW